MSVTIYRHTQWSNYEDVPYIILGKSWDFVNFLAPQMSRLFLDLFSKNFSKKNEKKSAFFRFFFQFFRKKTAILIKIIEILLILRFFQKIPDFFPNFAILR